LQGNQCQLFVVQNAVQLLTCRVRVRLRLG